MVNPTAPLSILNAVLERAQAVWTKQYSPDGLLQEVESELTAYWENGEHDPLLICEDSVETHRVTRVTCEMLLSGKRVYRVAAIRSGTQAKHQRVALVVTVPRDRLLSLLDDSRTSLLSLPDLSVALQTLEGYLAAGTIRKRSVECWILLKCETRAAHVWIALQLVERFTIDFCREDFTAKSVRWLAHATFRRVQVQDLRGRRLRARTAGHERSTEFAGLRLALAGCGSLGGFLADGLARAGVNHWLFIDTDLLRPENLARHLLDCDSLYFSKAEALAAKLKRRAVDLETAFFTSAVQTEGGLKAVQDFGPSLLISATGDTNTDLTLSELCRKGILGDCCFTWVEPNLAAGHLVYQPQGTGRGLHDLHELVGADAYYYRHRIVGDPRALEQMEMGCQAVFTPYSGADMQQFAHAAVIQVARLLLERPSDLFIRRFQDSAWQTVAA